MCVRLAKRRDMGLSRKFYYGDVVRVVGNQYGGHTGHIGRVAQTTITRRLKTNREAIVYDIACECGKTIRPVTRFLERFDSTQDEFSLNIARMRYLLDTIGAVVPDDDHLQEEVERKLSNLKPRYKQVIELRFGLTEGPQTYQAIGDMLGCSRQDVHQITNRALKKLAR